MCGTVLNKKFGYTKTLTLHSCAQFIVLPRIALHMEILAYVAHFVIANKIKNKRRLKSRQCIACLDLRLYIHFLLTK